MHQIGPYQQPTYAYNPVSAPPRKNLVLTGKIAVVIIVLTLGLSSCGFIMYVDPNPAFLDWATFAASASQTYNGSLDVHLMNIILKNESFAPDGIMANASGFPLIVFHPFYGVNGTYDANRSKLLMNPSSNNITIVGHTTIINYRTGDFRRPDRSEKQLKDHLKLVESKVEKIFETQLGLKLTHETMKYEQTSAGD